MVTNIHAILNNVRLARRADDTTILLSVGPPSEVKVIDFINWPSLLFSGAEIARIVGFVTMFGDTGSR